MKKSIWLLGLLFLGFTSCNKEDSVDVNQDKIYCDYELFYNQNDDKTHAVARFRFGSATGTVLELTDSTDASVTFNGEVLPYNVWYNGHHKEYAGQVTSGSFVYTNSNGDTYTNAVPNGESIAFPTGFDTITKSIAQTLTWDGTALSPDQHVGFFVGTPTWGQDALFFTADNGGTNIVLGVNQKSNLALGNATLFMDRSTATNVTEGTSKGGRIRYRYRCTNVAGFVED